MLLRIYLLDLYPKLAMTFQAKPEFLLCPIDSVVDCILIREFWKRQGVYGITVSPKKMSSGEEGVWRFAIAYQLSKYDHVSVFERADGRLHLHGVIKLGRSHLKAKDSMELVFHAHNATIGFCKFETNPRYKWYHYLFKEPDCQIFYKANSKTRYASINISEYLTAEQVCQIDTESGAATPPQPPLNENDADYNLVSLLNI